MDDFSFRKAREARTAIERIYVEMRHLFNRGSYKPLGTSGEVLQDALLTLSPEIYGSMGDPHKVELEGLVYVIDRLPKGIEACRFVKLISEEGYGDSEFDVIVPNSRRRNCYRIDAEQMFIEVTRGRSEIYDILTHLTFLYIEAEKIRKHVTIEKGKTRLEWKKLKSIVKGESTLTEKNTGVALTYLSTILGRSYAETKHAYERMKAHDETNNGLFHIVYGLGQVAIEAESHDKPREISFSPILRERIGHHIYGERWANQIKELLSKEGLMERPIHVISANLHSVINSLFAYSAFTNTPQKRGSLVEMAHELSKPKNVFLQERVQATAMQGGMYTLDDPFGTNISVQIFDTAKIDLTQLSPELEVDKDWIKDVKPIIIVMDYAFGEQAYETMDELLKPYETEKGNIQMSVSSISIMGKAGILFGGKGDIMVPNSHVFEGTADNYPFKNDFTCEDFENCDAEVYEGPMISVLGTSLQNREVLAYFRNTSWQAIGLEMEGAHYQKAIQSAAHIRKHISEDVVLRYAYYASDNPLETGSTLASGSLGKIGVKPTYLITQKILSRILSGQPGRKSSTLVKTKQKNS